jgi:Flp pilus assembly pilin Flp
MLDLYVRVLHWVGAVGSAAWAASGLRRRSGRPEDGQTTAEYALVLLAAAAVAFVLIAWARSSGRLPAFFDQIIDNITGSVP